ncbi:hypothetical protein BASA81_008284 [Batrachochytrium salamandrivorans]|nr:hypothetical protein BASA81_008284 [Batrachochytrium salamandrivorans]
MSKPGVEYLFMVNPAGGLIFNMAWGAAPNLSENDAIRLASTFHSLVAISQQISPTGRGGGICELETTGFSLRCFQTLTGLKLFCTATPGTMHIPTYLKQVYDLYCDWVLKDPFYELDMPIRVERFESRLVALTTERFGHRTN